MTDRPREARLTQVAALPWRRKRNGSLSILLVTSRTNGKWMLPKGWPMPGKSDAEAAQQEAKEEAGVTGIIAEAAIGSYYYIREEADESTSPAQALVFSLQVTGKLSRWQEKGQRRRRWFSAEDAAAAVYEADLARFLGNVAAGRIYLS